jgi:hypothetical protein
MKGKAPILESIVSIAGWAIPIAVLGLTPYLIQFFQAIPPKYSIKPLLVGIALLLGLVVLLSARLYLLYVRPRPLPYPFDNERGFYNHPSGEKLCPKCWVIHREVSFLIQIGDTGYDCKVCDQKYMFHTPKRPNP